MLLLIATKTLWLVYVVSLEFAVLAAVGYLVRLAVRSLVRWYLVAVARTNEYWASQRLEGQILGEPDSSRNSGSSQHRQR